MDKQMNNRSLRYSKLMKSMGLPEQSEPVTPELDQQTMSPQKIEALTGTEHPELAKNRKLKMLIDAKIAELEQSEDPNALESLNFWKQKQSKFAAD